MIKTDFDIYINSNDKGSMPVVTLISAVKHSSLVHKLLLSCDVQQNEVAKP